MNFMDTDKELDRVVATLLALDASVDRFASVYRQTFDQLYDGQRTGRYSWGQLYKTEKTHFGTLIEINLQREFDFVDGDVLDYKIDGIEVDCKYSFKSGSWMLPPECWGELIMVSTADDVHSLWSLGVVRVSELNRRTTVNRDGKTTLSQEGRNAVRWVFRDLDMPPNVLLQLPEEAVRKIYERKRGQARLDELFRQAEGMLVHRSSVATAAQQHDYMKRVRSNGGSRSTLGKEGYLIVSGDYENQRQIAREFALPIPGPGEFVSFRVLPTAESDPMSVALDGGFWRMAKLDEPSTSAAPSLPKQGERRTDGELVQPEDLTE